MGKGANHSCPVPELALRHSEALVSAGAAGTSRVMSANGWGIVKPSFQARHGLGNSVLMLLQGLFEQPACGAGIGSCQERSRGIFDLEALRLRCFVQSGAGKTCLAPLLGGPLEMGANRPGPERHRHPMPPVPHPVRSGT